MGGVYPQVRGRALFVKQQKRKDGRVYLSVVEGYRDAECFCSIVC